MYTKIVDYIIAHDLEFNQFRELYKKEFKKLPIKKVYNKALLYFETGIIETN